MGLYGLGFVLGKLPLLEWILSKQEHFNFCLSEEEESGRTPQQTSTPLAISRKCHGRCSQEPHTSLLTVFWTLLF